MAEESVTRLDAGKKCLLSEIFRVSWDLMCEESVDLVQMASAQLLSCTQVAVAPALQQNEVVIHPEV